MKQFVVAITTSITLALGFALPAYAITYGGDATGAEVTVSATGTTIRAATGTLGISGGMTDASVLVGDIPSSATAGAVALTASVLHSAIVGVGNATNAEASMGAISLTVSGNTFSADFLMSRSQASCGTGPSVAGTSQLGNLVINGTPITVSGAPNQTVSLPNGTAIINAQTSTVGGTAGELAVTALRVLTHDTITGQPIADAAMTTVDAKVDCAAGTSNTENWVTGGGWVPSGVNGKATFGFVAGRRNGESGFSGHITVKDHANNQSFQGTVIITFDCTSGHATFSGTGNGGAFDADVQDAGEPGNADTFSFTSGTVNTAGTLGGGNIQGHGASCAQ